MLKNKKQILLILAVIALYAAIAMRFKGFVGESDYQGSGESWSIESVEADTTKNYQLSLNYPDPFKVKKEGPKRSTYADDRNMGSHQRPYRQNIPKQTLQQTTPAPEQVKMELIGTINVENPNQDMCIVKVDNHEHVLKKGDSLRGFFIQKIFHDSIVATQNNQRYTYKTTSK